MGQLEEMFRVVLSSDRMSAELHCTDDYDPLRWENPDREEMLAFLRKNQVEYGLDENILREVLNKGTTSFPVTIASGTPPVHGQDGKIAYELDMSTEIKRTSDWNFRDVMRIPTVEKGQKLVTIIPPAPGKDGKDVCGNVVQAKPGKPIKLIAGKNVEYKENESAFYATEAGQLSIVGKYVHVYPVFEVRETLSMKSGNLDFIGTIVIRGDVPSGFMVKAGGDIKIYGMVEAAEIISGGSVYISEGISGQMKGKVEAKENITIGYINQGNVQAGNNLYVENSIFHSKCIVKNEVYCQRGSIIGGFISAGKSVEAKDIGNRLSTKTEIVFGVHKLNFEKEQMLIGKKKELLETLRKLELLGKKLREQDLANNPKLRISLLRQRNASEKTKKQLAKIDETLTQLHSQIGDFQTANLTVRNNLYQNVTVSFGKYKRTIEKDFHFVRVFLQDNEIVIEPLYN
ncbi:polymerase [Compostibacillus humi]|uniref:Polymerase n=1 Tax=Compostibacillus humi TaxID=1245525 RepID=A0A8J2ZQP8_9BACI|nr:FapA family protein [Compostibacillus humi]GGH69664.1 polymerase [Compostibacillus humi]HLT55515.1 FapA family protein [Bacillota bacterium]